MDHTGQSAYKGIVKQAEIAIKGIVGKDSDGVDITKTYTFKMNIGFMRTESLQYNAYQFDGILGLGPSANDVLKDTNILYVMKNQGILSYENFHIPPMSFNNEQNRFNGNMTIGTSEFDGTSNSTTQDYFFDEMPIPFIP